MSGLPEAVRVTARSQKQQSPIAGALLCDVGLELCGLWRFPCAGWWSALDRMKTRDLAETVRFELTDGCPSAVFKTAGLNHSPKSPGWKPHTLAARQRRRGLHAVRFPYGRCARAKATRLHMPSDLSSSSVSLEGTGGRGTSASASARVCAISASGSGVSCGSKSYSLMNSVRSMASSR